MGRVPHFGCDGEESRGAGIGEDDGRDRGDSFRECGIALHNLIIGNPDGIFWRSGGTVLDTDGDGHDENYGAVRSDPRCGE